MTPPEHCLAWEHHQRNVGRLIKQRVNNDAAPCHSRLPQVPPVACRARAGLHVTLMALAAHQHTALGRCAGAGVCDGARVGVGCARRALGCQRHAGGQQLQVARDGHDLAQPGLARRQRRSLYWRPGLQQRPAQPPDGQRAARRAHQLPAQLAQARARLHKSLLVSRRVVSV